MKKFSIYNLFSKRNNNQMSWTQNLNYNGDYVELEHNSKLLMKLMKNDFESSMVVVNFLVNDHWILLVAVDSCQIGASSAPGSETIRIYYFNSYRNNNTPFLEQNVNDVTDYQKYRGIIR